ncbi:MAG: DoxX family protein [Saezia sp.]
MKKILSTFETLLDCPDLGRLILRLSIGGLLFLHGWHKVLNGTSWIQGQLATLNLPTFIAYGVYAGEVIAPVLLILGILTRFSALTVAATMVVAWLLGALHKTFTLDQVGAWGLEANAFFFFGGLAIAFLGAGRFSLAKNSMWR